MFEALGIVQTDEHIYLQLLRNGPASVPALSVITGLGRHVVQTSVDRLQASGLTQTSPMPPQRIIAIPLETAVDHLIRQRKHDLELIRNTASKLAAELHTRTQRGPDDQVTVLHQRNDVALALEELHQTAHDELRVLIRSPFDLPPGGSVTRRVVRDTSLSPVPAGVAQLRLASNVPANLVLADHTSALMPLEATAVIVKPGNLFDALDALFNAVWRNATPFGGSPSIDANDQALLSLLVAGLTDDAAGARLGMSRRTVARRVQRLMEATGAHSRLQLGWWAREREWLS
jgi:predicted transcriptional regulator